MFLFGSPSVTEFVYLSVCLCLSELDECTPNLNQIGSLACYSSGRYSVSQDGCWSNPNNIRGGHLSLSTRIHFPRRYWPVSPLRHWLFNQCDEVETFFGLVVKSAATGSILWRAQDLFVLEIFLTLIIVPATRQRKRKLKTLTKKALSWNYGSAQKQTLMMMMKYDVRANRIVWTES